MEGVSLASKRKRPPAAQQANPTPERLARARGDYGYGDDREKPTLTMRDYPLERLRHDLTRGQFAAAEKYRHHWFQAGLSDPLQSLDLNRIFGGDISCGMAKSEGQYFHRQKYREANEAIGMIGAAIIDHVVCRERPLVEFGVAVGWKSKSKAIDAARDTLVGALEKLRLLWGLS